MQPLCDRADARCQTPPLTNSLGPSDTPPPTQVHTLSPFSTPNKSSATSSSNQSATDPAGLESKESSLSALPPSITAPLPQKHLDAERDRFQLSQRDRDSDPGYRKTDCKDRQTLQGNSQQTPSQPRPRCQGAQQGRKGRRSADPHSRGGAGPGPRGMSLPLKAPES